MARAVEGPHAPPHNHRPRKEFPPPTYPKIFVLPSATCGPLKPAFDLRGDVHTSQTQANEQVKPGLCERPEDWEWTSFRHYATGREGRIEIESERTARKRERAAGSLCPALEPPHSSQNHARVGHPPAHHAKSRKPVRL